MSLLFNWYIATLLRFCTPWVMGLSNGLWKVRGGERERQGLQERTTALGAAFHSVLVFVPMFYGGFSA
ncbi:MAG: hypothetical protein VYE04_11140 [Pseudomonadota bacterium]|nr:hypothetical protein [Pseudomonadota bacterium]